MIIIQVPEIAKTEKLNREELRSVAVGGKLKLGKDLGWQITVDVPLGISYTSYEPIGTSYSDSNGHFQCDGEEWKVTYF